jgi:hypothetical protein
MQVGRTLWWQEPKMEESLDLMEARKERECLS